jgi:hypothetical protein
MAMQLVLELALELVLEPVWHLELKSCVGWQVSCRPIRRPGGEIKYFLLHQIAKFLQKMPQIFP